MGLGYTEATLVTISKIRSIGLTPFRAWLILLGIIQLLSIIAIFVCFNKNNTAVNLNMTTHWFQTEFTLPAKQKGIYLITNDVLGEINHELSKVKIGQLNLFAKHTSCALTLNENFDPDVRTDMDKALDHAVPYNQPFCKYFNCLTSIVAHLLRFCFVFFAICLFKEKKIPNYMMRQKFFFIFPMNIGYNDSIIFHLYSHSDNTSFDFFFPLETGF